MNVRILFACHWAEDYNGIAHSKATGYSLFHYLEEGYSPRSSSAIAAGEPVASAPSASFDSSSALA